MESRILNLFAYDSQLNFSQIKEKLEIHSNLLAYWLKKMVRKKLLVKSGGFYSLAESAEHLVPYLSENMSVLPVILVMIGDSKEVFLYKRNKRPYKNLLSLPGSRLLIGESIEGAAKRLMKAKFGISIGKIRIKSVNLEHVKKKGKIIYSFLLILVSATAKETVELTNIEKNKKKIIPSDYTLIASKNKKNIDIKTIMSAYK